MSAEHFGCLVRRDSGSSWLFNLIHSDLAIANYEASNLDPVISLNLSPLVIVDEPRALITAPGKLGPVSFFRAVHSFVSPEHIRCKFRFGSWLRRKRKLGLWVVALIAPINANSLIRRDNKVPFHNYSLEFSCRRSVPRFSKRYPFGVVASS